MSDSTDKDLPDGQELDDYLRGGSAVSRQYRELHSADVPAQLDRLVLRQAQEAVKPRARKSRTWLRWSGPLALAASAVLVVSIVIESGVHKETHLSVPASAPMETQVTTEAPAAAEDRATANDASGSVPVPVVPVVPPPVEMNFEPAPTVELTPPPLEAPMPQSAPAPDRAIAPATERPTLPPPVTAPAPQAEHRAISQRKAIEPVPTTARARETDTDSNELEETIVSGNAVRSLDQDVQSTPIAEPSRAAGPRNTIAVPVRPLSDSAKRQEQPRNYSDPEQWLRDIRELRKQNKHEEADREWRRFRYVFPDYAVAEDDPARRAIP